MNPIALHLIDGGTFFAGLIAVTVGVVCLMFSQNRLVQSVLVVLTLAGVVLVVASGTPAGLWAYLLWLAATFTGLVISLWTRSINKPRVISSVAALVLTLVLAGMEIPHHITPVVPVNAQAKVYVLGDSISAGVGQETTWPTMLAKQTGLGIVNLARPGATVEGALKQAESIGAEPGLVIIEIGGNDLLGRTSAEEYHNQLDQLLTRVSNQGHRVIMLEIPLFPFLNGYGRAQRTLAVKHGAALVPKRHLTSALKAGTIDGLHLSEAGHQSLAKSVGSVLDIQTSSP
jgi:acyl-CoA thioesterase-1